MLTPEHSRCTPANVASSIWTAHSLVGSCNWSFHLYLRRRLDRRYWSFNDNDMSSMQKFPRRGSRSLVLFAAAEKQRRVTSKMLGKLMFYALHDCNMDARCSQLRRRTPLTTWHFRKRKMLLQDCVVAAMRQV